jgi:glycosyltransferase involved in cell wall biosynthesis
MSENPEKMLSYTTDTLVVLMPAYNATAFLDEAIRSILEQTFTDFDLLVVDDCSTDGTAEMIRSYEDPRVHLMQRSENGGVVSALNVGLDHVKHKYIARMDADDRSVLDRFEKQFNFLQENPDIDMVGAHLRNFGVEAAEWNYPLTHDEIKAGFLFGNCFPHASLMAKAEVFKDARYSKCVPHMEDYELWLRLIEKYRFAILPDRLYEYRRHDEGVTIAFKQSHRKRLKTLLREPLKWLGIEPTETELNLLAVDPNALQGGYETYMETYHQLLQRIERANNVKQVFDPAALKKVLDENWQRYFYLMDTADPRVALKYWNLSKRMPASQLRYLIGGLKRKVFS